MCGVNCCKYCYILLSINILLVLGVVGFVWLGVCLILIILVINIVWCVVNVWFDLVIMVGCLRLCCWYILVNVLMILCVYLLIL